MGVACAQAGVAEVAIENDRKRAFVNRDRRHLGGGTLRRGRREETCGNHDEECLYEPREHASPQQHKTQVDYAWFIRTSQENESGATQRPS
jgi:hypothetical protein